ncbi:MAG: carboxymuconolactone decarboxylase family protein [Planctomycetes bacterium]|nr:carboxymuconolactone decarboxylase family protein [Planctomycetota bacterium]
MSGGDKPWIRIIPESDATGPLADHYKAAVKRAGKVFNIIKIQSLRPDFIDASMRLYSAAMFAPSGLTRAEREMLATVVSSANHCDY